MPGRRPLEPGDPERIGDHLLIGVLGEGGQGIVYRARTPTGTPVAIKVLHARTAADPGAGRRLLREAEIARRIAPFCTARVLDMGVFRGRPYIVSEYIPGIALDALVARDGPRAGSGLHRLAVATLTSLAAIHRAGVVHHDVKPGNVILGPEGPVVIDFGISRVLEQVSTRSGPVGTPAYMAPERFERRPAGPAADVFGWAATMVFAATGHPAFRGPSLPAVMHAIVVGEPDLDGVAEELRPLLAACLDKRPGERPGAAVVLRHLTHDYRPGLSVLPGLVPGGSVGVSVPVGSVSGVTSGRRRRVLLGGLIALAAAGVGVAVPSWLSGPDGTHLAAPDPTESTTSAGSALGRPLTGHGAAVTSVALGVLGGEAVAVSGGSDGTVRVWDLAAGRQIGRSLTGHFDTVWSVALGVLGGEAVAVSGGSDGTVRVWDLAAGRQVGASLTGQGDAVWSVALGQADGEAIVVSVGYDGTVWMRDLMTRKQIGTSLTGRLDTVTSVALGELGGEAVAVSGGSDGTVRVWDLVRGRQLGRPLTGHSGAVTSVALGRVDGEVVAVSGGSDGTLRLWKLGLPGPPPSPR
ncbi:hypothetical protein FHR32_001485 [Streptosporangium album]|uniref:Protein kinase domain-containing protein n=1 Tax=Streptosporangium album TaxID=47479 RepID=A0A7W7RS82_9ACTN|nr:serine/threonine-protein kinase [Streptosporangium album]MBB4937180.1 hypothetical protein [Streptosporangium album]